MDGVALAISAKVHTELGDDREAVADLDRLMATAARLRELLVAELEERARRDAGTTPEQVERRRAVVARADAKRRPRQHDAPSAATGAVGPSA